MGARELLLEQIYNDTSGAPGGFLSFSDYAPEALRSVAKALLAMLQETLGALSGLSGDGTHAHDFGLQVTTPHDEEVNRQLQDTCFAATLELRQMERTLSQALGSSAMDLADTCDAARRKIHRALRAILDAYDSTQLRTQLQMDGRSDLEAAIGIRRLFSDFWRALWRVERVSMDDGTAVRAALQLALDLIHRMMADPEYANVRPADRKLFSDMRQRILLWQTDSGDVLSGRQLYADVVAVADLLRGVNMRQELRAHDVSVLRQIGKLLRYNTLTEETARDLLPWFETIRGRDDRLDDLLAKLATGGIDAGQLAQLPCIVDEVSAELA